MASRCIDELPSVICFDGLHLFHHCLSLARLDFSFLEGARFFSKCKMQFVKELVVVDFAINIVGLL